MFAPEQRLRLGIAGDRLLLAVPPDAPADAMADVTQVARNRAQVTQFDIGIGPRARPHAFEEVALVRDVHPSVVNLLWIGAVVLGEQRVAPSVDPDRAFRAIELDAVGPCRPRADCRCRGASRT